MRKLALVVILVALVLTPLIAEEEPEAPLPDLTVRIVRTDEALSIDLEPDAWRILAGEERASVLAEIEAAPGVETVLRIPKGLADREWSVSALERVPYVADHEVDLELESLKEIVKTLKLGLIADISIGPASERNGIAVVARITLADLVMPVQKFHVSTNGVGQTPEIELPELAVRRLDKPVSLTAGQWAIFPAGRVGREEARKHVYLLVLTDAGAGVEDSPGDFPPRLR